MVDWADTLDHWVTPDGWKKVLAVDAHAEGEPLRMIIDGFPTAPDTDVRAWRRAAQRDHELRQALMWEPRGHADMYGCIVDHR